MRRLKPASKSKLRREQQGLHGKQWDTRVQNADEQKRMAYYMRRAQKGGAPNGCCKTCAFRPGTEANLSAANLELIEETLVAGGRFLCHRGGTMIAGGFVVEAQNAPECAGMIAIKIAHYDVSNKEGAQ